MNKNLKTIFSFKSLLLWFFGFWLLLRGFLFDGGVLFGSSVLFHSSNCFFGLISLLLCFSLLNFNFFTSIFGGSRFRNRFLFILLFRFVALFDNLTLSSSSNWFFFFFLGLLSMLLFLPFLYKLVIIFNLFFCF